MQGIITLIIIVAQTFNPMPVEVADNATFEYIGQLPEMIVTAPRYENEDAAWSGMMPENVATAPRYENEDAAWSGMMPETVVTAPRYEAEIKDVSAIKRIDIAAYSNEELSDNMTYCTTTPNDNDIHSNVLRQTLLPQFANAQCLDHIKIKPAGMTMSGNYHVPEGDTVDEDVTISGGNAKIDGVVDGDLAVMGGMVDVNGRVEGDVAVFGGNLDITGTIEGDAAVFGGHINNKGLIEGDLFVIGGTVRLDSASVVEGDISMVGGTVDRDENAEVEGSIESVEVEALNKVLPRISHAFRFPHLIPGKGIFTAVFSIAVLIVVYILTLLLLLIFPEAIDRIVEKIHLNVWASVGFGLGLEILYVPMIVLLTVSLIGILILPAFVLAVFLGALFGFSSMSLIVGTQLNKGLNWNIKSRVGLFSLGWVALMIIPLLGAILSSIDVVGSLISILGSVIIYVATTIGIGGAVYALIKRKKQSSKK